MKILGMEWPGCYCKQMLSTQECGEDLYKRSKRIQQEAGSRTRFVRSEQDWDVCTFCLHHVFASFVCIPGVPWYELGIMCL